MTGMTVPIWLSSASGHPKRKAYSSTLYHILEYNYIASAQLCSTPVKNDSRSARKSVEEIMANRSRKPRKLVGKLVAKTRQDTTPYERRHLKAIVVAHFTNVSLCMLTFLIPSFLLFASHFCIMLYILHTYYSMYYHYVPCPCMYNIIEYDIVTSL